MQSVLRVLLLLFFMGMIFFLIWLFREKESAIEGVCCLYAYYEKNDEYKENLEYFLDHGILSDVDYYIIVNGMCSVDIPRSANIHVYFRENKGYDFGAYSHAVRKMGKKYSHYFFINTSVRGPLLRHGRDNAPWTSYFIHLLGGDTRLAGTSINIYTAANLDRYYGKKNVYSHVQSMFFVMDHQLFSLLKKRHFFNESAIDNMDMESVILRKEIGLSQIALAEGWNINSILPLYRGLDYRTLDHDINPTSVGGDPYFHGAYFGGTIDPYDVIFFKNNRW